MYYGTLAVLVATALTIQSVNSSEQDKTAHLHQDETVSIGQILESMLDEKLEASFYDQQLLGESFVSSISRWTKTTNIGGGSFSYQFVKSTEEVNRLSVSSIGVQIDAFLGKLGSNLLTELKTQRHSSNFTSKLVIYGVGDSHLEEMKDICGPVFGRRICLSKTVGDSFVTKIYSRSHNLVIVDNVVLGATKEKNFKTGGGVAVEFLELETKLKGNFESNEDDSVRSSLMTLQVYGSMGKQKLKTVESIIEVIQFLNDMKTAIEGKGGQYAFKSTTYNTFLSTCSGTYTLRDDCKSTFDRPINMEVFRLAQQMVSNARDSVQEAQNQVQLIRNLPMCEQTREIRAVQAVLGDFQRRQYAFLDVSKTLVSCLRDPKCNVNNTFTNFNAEFAHVKSFDVSEISDLYTIASFVKSLSTTNITVVTDFTIEPSISSTDFKLVYMLHLSDYNNSHSNFAALKSEIVNLANQESTSCYVRICRSAESNRITYFNKKGVQEAYDAKLHSPSKLMSWKSEAETMSTIAHWLFLLHPLG